MTPLGSGTAVAATGGKFILGRSNAATTTTTLSNSKGTALSLRAPSNKSPLAVSNGNRVTNLNADAVDGVSAEGVARTSGRTVTRHAFSTTDTLVAQAYCPGGTSLTGGGYEDDTASGIVVQNSPGPTVGLSQVTVVVDPTANEDAQSVRAWAQC